MSGYHARHRDTHDTGHTGRLHRTGSASALSTRVLGATAALALLGGGSVAYASVAGPGGADPSGSAEAAAWPAVPQQAVLEMTAARADSTDLQVSRSTSRLSAHLAASAATDAAAAAAAKAAADEASKAAAEQARVAAEQAAKAAADAAAKAAADAAAAEAQKKADAERAARDAAAKAASVDPRSVARAMLGEFGWSASQFSCLDSLWTKESGWNPLATNKSSGAYGIPQSLPASKMATAGADYRTNPATQIRWGLGYIKASYGAPCSAWAHSQATNWY